MCCAGAVRGWAPPLRLGRTWAPRVHLAIRRPRAPDPPAGAIPQWSSVPAAPDPQACTSDTFLTGCGDGNVLLWSSAGQCLGRLQQGRERPDNVLADPPGVWPGPRLAGPSGPVSDRVTTRLDPPPPPTSPPGCLRIDGPGRNLRQQFLGRCRLVECRCARGSREAGEGIVGVRGRWGDGEREAESVRIGRPTCMGGCRVPYVEGVCACVCVCACVACMPAWASDASCVGRR